MENQDQVFHPSHRPWKSRCDFHIPNSSDTPRKSAKPKPGFPLSLGSTIRTLDLNEKEF
jgi:hypothetical protein